MEFDEVNNFQLLLQRKTYSGPFFLLWPVDLVNLGSTHLYQAFDVLDFDQPHARLLPFSFHSQLGTLVCWVELGSLFMPVVQLPCWCQT